MNGSNTEICNPSPFIRFSTRMWENAYVNTIRRAMACDIVKCVFFFFRYFFYFAEGIIVRI